MKLLLDTHTLIWSLGHPKMLPASVIKLIDDQRNQVHFSAISLLEIAVKRMSWRRVRIDATAAEIERIALEAGFAPLPVTSRHAIAVEDLPEHHNDPFDRLLVAQAIVERLRLVTQDEVLPRYSDTIISY